MRPRVYTVLRVLTVQRDSTHSMAAPAHNQELLPTECLSHTSSQGEMLCFSLLWGRVPGDQYVPFPSLLLAHTQPLKEHPGSAVSIHFKEKFCMEVVLKSARWPAGSCHPSWGPAPISQQPLLFHVLPSLPPQVSLLLPGRNPGRAVCSRWTSPAPLPWKPMDQADELAALHHVPILWNLRNHRHAHLPLLQHCAPGVRQNGFGYGHIHWR